MKKKEEREEELPNPCLLPPPYHAQLPLFALSAWLPGYNYQLLQSNMQPLPLPPLSGRERSCKSLPVNSNPDIKHLEQYCD